MSKPLSERSFIQVQAWIGPREIEALQRLQQQTGSTRSAVIRSLLNGKITVLASPSDTGPIEERQQAH